jgi:hypothetical protein
MAANTIRTAREFTEDDWHGYAGCELWDDGRQPLVRELNDKAQAVADRNGIEVTFIIDDDWNVATYRWNVEFPSQSLARIVIDGIRQDATPENLIEGGFEEC